MPATIVLGGQWGDEGKGKITDALAGESGMVVRANGGSNAGHTISTDQGVFKMHLVPSGILSPGTTCVIGAGVVIDPVQLASELADLRARGIDTSALVISDRAHVVLPFHPEIDRGEERLRGESPIGTTLRGIGPAYADKVSRRGMRMADLCDERQVRQRLERDFEARNRLLEGYYEGTPVDSNESIDQLLGAAELLAPFVGHAEDAVQDALARGTRVIVECAQGAMLDIDYGSYPFVTSSSPTAAGACQGAGIAPSQIERVIGVFKAYSSRVGSGPFPTELFDETGNEIRERGHEYGTTTGRARRIGWFDAVAARRVTRLNGVTDIALTLLTYSIRPDDPGRNRVSARWGEHSTHSHHFGRLRSGDSGPFADRWLARRHHCCPILCGPAGARPQVCSSHWRAHRRSCFDDRRRSGPRPARTSRTQRPGGGPLERIRRW